MDNERRVVCKVCLRQYSRYTCPRCNIGYCSLSCYKQHGESCTESFYKEQAEGELRSVRPGDDERRRMMEILKRVHDQQLEDEETRQPLVERLLGLRLGTGDDEEEDGEEDDEGGSSDLEGEGEEGSDAGAGEDEEDEDDDAEGGGRAAAHAEAALAALASVLSEQTLARLLQKAASQPSGEWEVEEADLSEAEWTAFQRAVALGQLGPGTAAPRRPWWTLAEARDLTLTATGQRLVAEVAPTAAAAPSASGSAASSGPVTVAAAAAGPEAAAEGRPEAAGSSPAGGQAGARRVAFAEEPGGSGRGTGGSVDGGGRVASTSTSAGGLPPPPEESLPPLTALTKAAPSPLLPWHLVEVLYGYCHVVRQCDGNWSYDPLTAAMGLLGLTDVLAAVPPPQRARRAGGAAAAAASAAGTASSATAAAAQRRGGGGGGCEQRGRGGKAPSSSHQDEDDEADVGPAPRLPQTASEACYNALSRACAPPVGTSRDRAYAISVLYDVVTVLQAGRSATVLALADARRMLVRALEAASGSGDGLRTDGNAAGGSSAAGTFSGGEGAEDDADEEEEDEEEGRGAGRKRPWVPPTHRAPGGDRAGGGRGKERGPALSKADRARLAAAERKLWFFLVWANGLRAEALVEALEAVAEEWRTQHETVVSAGGAEARARPGEVRVP